MTFEELDQRTILWNEIANWRRTIEERIDTQIDQCQEEINNEFFKWAGELNKYHSEFAYEHIMTELLDGYADSRFVVTEMRNLSLEESYFELYELVEITAKCNFDDDVLLEAYRRVIESNFSKFVDLSEKHDLMWAQGEALKMSTLLGSEQLITVELTQGYWVFRDQNGKIRKPSTFKPVDLSDLV